MWNEISCLLKVTIFRAKINEFLSKKIFPFWWFWTTLRWRKLATFYILQLVTLETTLRMYWRDPRLRVDHLLNNSSSDYILLHPETSKFIWFPDIYIGKSNFCLIIQFLKYVNFCAKNIWKICEIEKLFFLWFFILLQPKNF